VKSPNRQIICALDTSDRAEVRRIVEQLSPYVGAFKIGHALTLSGGLAVVDELREWGAQRVFLDLKFHDIPNVVALAVKEAADRGVWMLTVHSSGGPAMLAAAAEAADSVAPEQRPIVLGVSVLTSIDETNLHRDLGVARGLEEHAVALSQMAVAQGVDGVVCSPHEISAIRAAVGSSAVIVTPGIRAPKGDVHDQKRIATAEQALADGASYLVIGRALTEASDPLEALASLGFGT